MKKMSVESHKIKAAIIIFTISKDELNIYDVKGVASNDFKHIIMSYL